MKFTIGAHEGDIDFTDLTDIHRCIFELGTHPAVQAAATDFADGQSLRAWEPIDDLQDQTATEFAKIVLTKGTDALAEYMLDKEFVRSPSDYLYENGGLAEAHALSDDIVAKFRALSGQEDADALKESLDIFIVEAVTEKMADKDRSVPADAIPRGATVQVAYVQGLGDEGMTQTSHVQNVANVESTVPDVELMRLFRLLNVSPVDFLQHVAVTRGFDMMQPEFDEGASASHRAAYLGNAARWKFVKEVFDGAEVDVTQTGIDDIDDPKARIAFAQAVRATRDISRPQAVSLEQVETILENAGYGGAATFLFAADLRELVRGEFEGSFVASDGGMVGLHDYDGSGFLVPTDDHILIDMKAGRLITPGMYGPAFEKVYGFRARDLAADTRGARPEPWAEFAEGNWRSTAPTADGGFMTVVAVAGDMAKTALRNVNGDTLAEAANSLGDEGLKGARVDASRMLARQAAVSSAGPSNRR